nr:MAG TPA: hypothetical protein [Caudoviricetes sp.]
MDLGIHYHLILSFWTPERESFIIVFIINDLYII